MVIIKVILRKKDTHKNILRQQRKRWGAVGAQGNFSPIQGRKTHLIKLINAWKCRDYKNMFFYSIWRNITAIDRTVLKSNNFYFCTQSDSTWNLGFELRAIFTRWTVKVYFFFKVGI